MRKKIGFIGLGHMGKWMAGLILKEGFDLTVFDIDTKTVKLLSDQGAQTAQDPLEMAERVDWIFLCLPDAVAVENTLFGETGLAKVPTKDLIVVDLGTTAYLKTLEFAERLYVLGIQFADAPVSGMEAGAKAGTLTIMLGGSRAVWEQIRPVLNILGNRIVYMGAVGNGQLAKLVNQLLFNISMAAMAEVLPMAVKLGLDPEKVSRVVTTGTGRSFGAEFFIPHILESRFNSGYPLKSAYKDMRSAAEISAQHKIPLPLVHAATSTYQMALTEGYGDEDKGAMIKVFERILGVRFRKKAMSASA